jgi:hypothetical protein
MAKEVMAMIHSHGLAKRLHWEEQHLRAALETTLLQYGVLLGALGVLVVVGLAIMYFQP